MRITHTVKKNVEETKDIFCNKCGKTCAVPLTSTHDMVNYHGLIEASVRGGYRSPVLTDGATYTFSLCELCLAKMMKTWLIEPETIGTVDENGQIF